MPTNIPCSDRPADIPLREGWVRRTTLFSISVGDKAIEDGLRRSG
jgi:hypothetical protein